jgi:DNA-binding TFAR19-related protein (PDSD5 family)
MSNDDKNFEQHKLEKIRMRKMKAMMDAKKQQEAAKERIGSISDKLESVLKVVLAPEAYSYLSNIKMNEPNVYQVIFNELISADVIQNIDYLIAIIRQQGGVPRKIPLDIIIHLERKAKGIRSKIQVKRGDDLMDLGSFLTKEE